MKLHINGSNLVIIDEDYVPELKINLMSIGQLPERGLAILIQPGKCSIYHPERGLIIQSEMTTSIVYARDLWRYEIFLTYLIRGV